MEEFWTRIRKRTKDMQALDKDNRLVDGSNRHQYEINPSIGLGDIESYEYLHGMRLPESYRDYLRYFGSGGVGPFSGIHRFPENIREGDLRKPLQLKIFKGYQYGDELWVSPLPGCNDVTGIEPLPQSLFDLDGMIDIGCSDGASRSFLVVNGPLRG